VGTTKYEVRKTISSNNIIIKVEEISNYNIRYVWKKIKEV